MKTIGIVILLIGVSVASAADAGPCNGLTLRQCEQLNPQNGTSDQECHNFPLGPAYPSIEYCLKIKLQLRQLIQQRLAGKLPNSSLQNKDTGCIRNNIGLYCVDLPREEYLDSPVDDHSNPVLNSDADDPVQKVAALGQLNAHTELRTLPGVMNVSVGHNDHNQVAIVLTSSNRNATLAAAPAFVGTTPVVVESEPVTR